MMTRTPLIRRPALPSGRPLLVAATWSRPPWVHPDYVYVRTPHGHGYYALSSQVVIANEDGRCFVPCTHVMDIGPEKYMVRFSGYDGLDATASLNRALCHEFPSEGQPVP